MLSCGQKGWLKPIKGQVDLTAWLGDTLELFLLWKSRNPSFIWLKLFSACTKILKLEIGVHSKGKNIKFLNNKQLK